MLDKIGYKSSYATESGLFSAEALHTITQDTIDKAEIEAISDAGVMVFFIPLTQKLLCEYNDWCWCTCIGMQNVVEDVVSCEYWIDDSCHYYLYSKRHLVNATEDFSCDYLDTMVRKKYEKQYKQ